MSNSAKILWSGGGIFLLATIYLQVSHVNWSPNSEFVGEDSEAEYVEFIPYTLDVTKNTYEEMHVPTYELYEAPDFKGNLIFVLDFYKLDYRLDEERVLISKQLSKDLGRLVDFTWKATGSEWREKQIELREIRRKLREDNQ
jgi:hypothetical protein